MKREESARRAREIYDRLMSLPRPDGYSNNQWASDAGVNTSFFTNLKNGSEPSVGNLRSVIEVQGITLPEFFLGEAHGRLSPTASVERLERAILEALPDAPKRYDKRARYLAEVVSQILQLPDDLHSTLSSAHPKAEADREEETAVRAATK
ncbi:hypothetical protein [Sphingopyxis sp. QXT-31]|uniref:hypothetical protein n=1 Tax=Sphingopyxis sp. QXT-31 TaxID=1357916 RepID=UPI0012EC9AF7|nr:hypothetical protein [Sphingopyxis sp. QXT-31]